jgi:hypothetical protein
VLAVEETEALCGVESNGTNKRKAKAGTAFDLVIVFPCIVEISGQHSTIVGEESPLHSESLL